MELITAYNKIHKIPRLHYITMESILNRVTKKFKNKPSNPYSQRDMKVMIEEEMRSRGVDLYFQVILSFTLGSVNITVKEKDKYNPQKECVLIWN